MAELLPGVGSVVEDDAVAVAVSVLPPLVAAATSATIVALRVAPGAVAPDHTQTTVIVPEQLPPAAVADTRLVPAGSGKLICAFCASEAPALLKAAV
jgi:hypothetical protein